VQPAHEDSAARVQAGGGAADGVAVGKSPGNHLHFLVVDASAGHLQITEPEHVTARQDMSRAVQGVKSG